MKEISKSNHQTASCQITLKLNAQHNRDKSSYSQLIPAVCQTFHFAFKINQYTAVKTCKNNYWNMFADNN